MLAHYHLKIDKSDENSFLIEAPRHYGFLTSIPERKVDRGHLFGTFVCPATDMTVEAIHKNVPAENLEFRSEYAEALYKSVLLKILMSDKIREQTAAYKESKIVPKHNLILDPRVSGYQTCAAANAVHTDGYAFWMEAGTGKTLSTIAVVDALAVGARILVVAPNNVRLNWVKEISKFSTRPTKATVIRGTQMARISRLIEALRKTGQDASVAIIGYDTIAGMWEALQMVEWDLVILDESHYIRNPKTKRWKYVMKLRDRAERRLILTGTPIANSINDLYTQFEFMGQGRSGFSNFTAFRRFYGVYDKTNPNDKTERLVALQNIPLMKDRISRSAFIISKQEALPDLPEKVYDIDEIEMCESQEQAYLRLASDLAIEIESEINAAEAAGSTALIVNNVLTMLLKLAQITSGFLNIPPERDQDGEIVKPGNQIQFAPNPKIERLAEVLTSKEKHQKTIVWACFEHDLLKIKKMCDVYGIRSVLFYGKTSDNDRKLAEDMFNEDDQCKVFIGNPGAGGTGLNLLGYPPGYPDDSECNVDHVIYYSQDWSSLKRSQSEDRAHRRGTRNNVQVTDLCVPGTIDETIRARVVEKRITAFELTDIRDILKEINNRD